MQRRSRYKMFSGRKAKSLGDWMIQRFVRYWKIASATLAVSSVNISGKGFGGAGFALPIATP
jgi:hypothetical protein